MTEIVSGIWSEAVFSLKVHAKDTAPVMTAIEAGHHHRFGAPERSAGRGDFGAAHPFEGAHVHDAREREVPEQCARRALTDAHALNPTVTNPRPLLVPPASTSPP